MSVLSDLAYLLGSRIMTQPQCQKLANGHGNSSKKYIGELEVPLSLARAQESLNGSIPHETHPPQLYG